MGVIHVEIWVSGILTVTSFLDGYVNTTFLNSTSPRIFSGFRPSLEELSISDCWGFQNKQNTNDDKYIKKACPSCSLTYRYFYIYCWLWISLHCYRRLKSLREICEDTCIGIWVEDAQNFMFHLTLQSAEFLHTPDISRLISWSYAVYPISTILMITITMLYNWCSMVSTINRQSNAIGWKRTRAYQVYQAVNFESGTARVGEVLDLRSSVSERECSDHDGEENLSMTNKYIQIIWQLLYSMNYTELF